MQSFIKDITELMDPPASPAYAVGDWANVERECGITFPKDFKEFIEAYGAGWINEFFYVMSPFAPTEQYSLLRQRDTSLWNFRSYYKDGLVKHPYPLYPEQGGLFPFTTTDNNNVLSWKTKGDPEDWDIVVWETDSLSFRELAVENFTLFLRNLLNGSSLYISENIMPPEWTENPTFAPAG